MIDDPCFFANLKIKDDKIPQSPCVTSWRGPSLKQMLSGSVAVPVDMRGRKNFLVKAHEYAAFGDDSSISVAILVSCLTCFKGWEGHFFNYLATATEKDENLELLTIDHNEGFDDIDPDDFSELYAHVLAIAMTRHFLNDEHCEAVFNAILAERRGFSQQLTFLGTNVVCPLSWMKAIKDQMQIVPNLKAAITRFLMTSTERKCKAILHDLRGAEMATFKACIFFTYHAPKTAAHVQPYIIREMLLLRKYVTKIKELPKEERELVALLYPGEFLPPIHVYSNLAFCTIYQYKRGEGLSETIDCPHKEDLRKLVRTKLKGPLNLTTLTPVERSLLEEVGITEEFQEESGPLLTDYNSPKLNEMLKTLVAEIRTPPRDPVETIESIIF